MSQARPTAWGGWGYCDPLCNKGRTFGWQGQLKMLEVTLNLITVCLKMYLRFLSLSSESANPFQDNLYLLIRRHPILRNTLLDNHITTTTTMNMTMTIIITIPGDEKGLLSPRV